MAPSFLAMRLNHASLITHPCLLGLPKVNRLSQMRRLNLFCPRQICNRPRQLQHVVECPRTQAQLIHRDVHQRATRLIQLIEFADVCRGHTCTALRVVQCRLVEFEHQYGGITDSDYVFVLKMDYPSRSYFSDQNVIMVVREGVYKNYAKGDVVRVYYSGEDPLEFIIAGE